MCACVLVVWQDTEIIEAPVNLSTLATRYASKMFDVDFLERRGLPAPEWMRAPRGRDKVDEALARVLVGDTE